MTASALAQVSLSALRANLMWFLLVAGLSGLASSLLVVVGATLLRAGVAATGWEVLVTVLFSSLTYAALVVLAQHSLLGLPTNGVTAVRRALDQALPVLVTFLALVLAVGVLSATLLGLPVAIFLLVRWAFCLQLVVIEGKDLKGAFTGSAALVKGSWRRVALVLLVTSVAMVLIQLLLVIAAGLPVGVFGGMLRLPPCRSPAMVGFCGECAGRPGSAASGGRGADGALLRPATRGGSPGGGGVAGFIQPALTPSRYPHPRRALRHANPHIGIGTLMSNSDNKRTDQAVFADPPIAVSPRGLSVSNL